MEDKNLSKKQPRSRAIVISLMVAIVAILIVAQVIFAAGSTVLSGETATSTSARLEPAERLSTSVAQAQDGAVITSTAIPVPGTPLNMEADDALGEYLRANTITSDNLITADDLDGSTKTVVPTQAQADTVVNYTIVVSNSTGVVANNVIMTDTLVAELAYISGTLTYPAGQTSGVSTNPDIKNNGVITWTGVVLANDDVTISFSARLTDTLAKGDYVTNTVEIGNGGIIISREAVTIIVTEPISKYMFLPVVFKPFAIPDAPTVQVSRPNSQNQWTVSWTDTNSVVTGFIIQESQDPSFNTILSTRQVAGNVTSSQYQHGLSTKNEYFYRVQTIGQNSSVISSWSAPASAVGGYYDDFTDSSTGWAIRRTTYLEEVRSWYEHNGDNYWFIIQVEDSWDWGLAAPYKTKAPAPPYAIEYTAKMVHTGNLVSHGAVFGGDWPGDETCPDYSSLDGLYRHAICFNHFYNTNTIWHGNQLKLLFERVDYLEWRPQDGGSPMKRGSFDDYDSWFTVSPIPDVDDDGWNTYRIEVRDSGIKLFANGREYAKTPVGYNNLWVNEPYFGVFASADEYSNSTWRFNYYKVTPLDN